MKKFFEIPSIDIVEFSLEDVITTSTLCDDDDSNETPTTPFG